MMEACLLGWFRCGAAVRGVVVVGFGKSQDPIEIISRSQELDDSWPFIFSARRRFSVVLLLV